MSNAGMRLDHELAERHWAFWNARRLKFFWNGESFSEQGDSNELSYSLSRIMIDLISDNKRKFRKFVLKADERDNGEAAAKKFLGKGLEEIVSSFLGART